MLQKQKNTKKNNVEFNRFDLLDQNKLNKKFLDYVEIGDLKNVKKIIEQGAEINCKNPKNKNALLIAIEKGNIEIIEFLIENKIKMFDKYEGKNISEITHEKVEIYEKIHEKIRDICFEKEDKISKCVREGKYIKVKKMIEETGIDVNENGLLPIAIYNQDQKMIKVLLEKGANINYVDKEGLNELMYKVRFKDIHKVKKLIEFGANYKIKDEKGRDLMYYAAISRSKRMVEYIESILYE